MVAQFDGLIMSSISALEGRPRRRWSGCSCGCATAFSQRRGERRRSADLEEARSDAMREVDAYFKRALERVPSIKASSTTSRQRCSRPRAARFLAPARVPQVQAVRGGRDQVPIVGRDEHRHLCAIQARPASRSARSRSRDRGPPSARPGSAGAAAPRRPARSRPARARRPTGSPAARRRDPPIPPRSRASRRPLAASRRRVAGAPDRQRELHVLQRAEERHEAGRLRTERDVAAPGTARAPRDPAPRGPSRASRTRPAVGRSRPATRRSSVDFPEPDGPVTMCSPPVANVASRSRTAWIARGARAVGPREVLHRDGRLGARGRARRAPSRGAGGGSSGARQPLASTMGSASASGP